MSAVPTPASDVAFTPSVKAAQLRKGSREAYRRMEEPGSWQTTITPDLAAFIAAQSRFLSLLEAYKAKLPAGDPQGDEPSTEVSDTAETAEAAELEVAETAAEDQAENDSTEEE